MNAVENEVPAIWRSPIFIGSKHIQPLDARRADGSWHTKAISDAQRLFKAIPKGEEPAFLTLRKGLRLPSPQSADAMTIGGGYVVISQKLRDVLVQFDLGATRLFELPVYKNTDLTPSGLPPHYMLHVCETKEGFLPDQSVGVERMHNALTGQPLPNGPWVFRGRNGGEEVAVAAATAKGVDLWGFANLRGHIFLSDRLKQAIDAENIKTQELTFHRCLTQR